MAEEKKEQTTQQSPPPAQSDGKRPPTRGQQKRRERSVFQYITILFAAALILMLFTFMMERRQNLEQIDDLQQNTNSATQRLEAILAERDQLKEETQSLEDEVARLEEQTQALEQSAAQQQELLDRTVKAMDLFWQIDEAYVRGRYSLCRELIRRLEEGGLAEVLPRESTTDNERFSPYDRYQEIYDRVF